MAISHLLTEALELALRAAELTDGDVDPTVGAALELAGYDRDWGLLNTPAPGDPRERGSAGDCRGDGPGGDRRTGAAAGDRGPTALGLADRHPGPQLRPCTRAQGHTAGCRGERERVGRRPRRRGRGAGDRLWSAGDIGGDVATSGAEPAGGWRIRVTDDHRSQPTAPGQTVAILSGGLATSSTTVRRWRHEGRAMHHIIDPARVRPHGHPGAPSASPPRLRRGEHREYGCTW